MSHLFIFTFKEITMYPCVFMAHVCFPRLLPVHFPLQTMTSELDSSLTSIDWLPTLGMSSLRSGKESGDRGGKRQRGRESELQVALSSPPGMKGKPPHSYATLISMAIGAAPDRKLSLNDIYTWISEQFPYYSRAGRGWKVS